LGGKYLARQRVSRQLPDGQVKYYTPEDFEIGNVVNILGRNFEVVDTDERSIKLLNGIEDRSTAADIQKLVIQLKEHLLIRYFRIQEAFRAMAGNCNGSIDVQELIQFYRTINVDIKPEDAKTIMDMYDKNCDGKLDYNEFIYLMEGDPFSYNLDELSLSPKSVSVNLGSSAPKIAETTTYQKSSVLGGSTTSAPEKPKILTDIFDEAFFGSTKEKRQRMLLQQLKNKINERRMLPVDVFRLLNGRSSDSKMYPKEFKYALKEILHMLLAEEEIKILCDVFFPGNKPCIYSAFQMIIDGAPPTPTLTKKDVTSSPR
jgi:troponin C